MTLPTLLETAHSALACLKGKALHLGCFVKDDTGVLNIPMAFVELCEGDPERVQLADSLQAAEWV